MEQLLLGKYLKQFVQEIEGTWGLAGKLQWEWEQGKEQAAVLLLELEQEQGLVLGLLLAEQEQWQACHTSALAVGRHLQ